jgi:hypothetical protein
MVRSRSSTKEIKMAAIESLTAEAIIALVNAGTWPPDFPIAQGDVVNGGDNVPVDVENASNVIIHVKNTGTAADAAGVVIFEGSINSTTGVDGDWFLIQAARTDSNVVETGRGASALAAGAAQGYAWEASVAGIRWFRVRSVVPSTALSKMHWFISPTADGSDPLPAIQPNTVSVAGTPNVAVPGGVAITGTPVVALSGTPNVAIPGVVSTTPYNGAGATAIVSAASTNASSIKTSSGQLMELSVFNPTAAVVYLKLYNKATAPAPATDGSLLMDVIPVPVNGRVAVEYGALGKRFPNGIGLAITGAPANADATAVAVGVIVSLTFL